MRKLIVSMNVTLNGAMSGPEGELDWHFQSWSSDMAAALCGQLADADTILLGRVTYMAMAGFWPAIALEVAVPREDLAFIEMMNRYRKVVVSGTLKRAEWNNSVLLRGNLEEEIRNLKEQPGKDIMIYGSGRLVSSLLSSCLIDEFQVWLHPLVLGKGKPLFRKGQPLQLIEQRAFDSGVVLLIYRSRNTV